ncbi:MAG: TRAP transporter substrate-binding protein DctP [Desulfatibacillaceae bacterium]|nr:TRAP transporter substrate-binding protein DctP [Desulfatibacillaceae bacterium]
MIQKPNPARSLALGLAVLLAVGLFLVTPKNLLAQEALTWRIATLAPQGVGWAHQVSEVILPAVEKASNGNLRLRIFWGGVRGDDADYLRMMSTGQIQGAGFSGQGAVLACPEFAVVELPFLFNNYDEVDYIRQRMTPTFDYYFSQHDIKLLFWVDQDFDQIYSSVSPLATLEDFRKANFVTWYGPIEKAVFDALGAKTTPMSVPQISAAWRAGKVDSGISPAIWMVGAQLYTVVRYVNPIKIRYAPVIIAVSMDAWNTLPKSYQDGIWAQRDDAVARFTAGTRRDNARSLEAMCGYGLTETKMSPAEFARLHKQAVSVYSDLADDVYPVGLLQELMRYLAEFRKDKPGAQTLEVELRPRTAPRPAPAAVARPAATPAVSAPSTPAAPTLAAQKAPIPAPAAENAWERRVRQIREVQAQLKGLGYYPGAVDGIFGPMTYNGIVRYQAEKGLPQTGALDPQLLEAMNIK